jgi:hypothetical protein
LEDKPVQKRNTRKSQRHTSAVLLLAALLLSATGFAASEPGAAVPTPPADITTVPIEEVKVIGRRMAALRLKITNARLNVYDIWNTLNTDDEFDMHCYLRKTTGSLIKQRICVAQFAEAAMQDTAKWAWLGLGTNGQPTNTNTGATAGIGGTGSPLTQGGIAAKNRQLRDKMLELANRHPELNAAIFDLKGLVDEYAEATRSCGDNC